MFMTEGEPDPRMADIQREILDAIEKEEGLVIATHVLCTVKYIVTPEI